MLGILPEDGSSWTLLSAWRRTPETAECGQQPAFVRSVRYVVRPEILKHLDGLSPSFSFAGFAAYRQSVFCLQGGSFWQDGAFLHCSAPAPQLSGKPGIRGLSAERH